MLKAKLKTVFYIALILFTFTSGCSNQATDKGNKVSNSNDFSVPVETIQVNAAPFTQYIEAVGTLESPETTELTSENKGKVAYLNIPEGEVVPKGHILAKVDDSTSSAEIKIAKAKLKNVDENYKRMKSLQEQGAVSKQTLDNALEELESAEGELERVESIQEKTTITAPFEGVLSFKNVSTGAFIDPGDVIVRISQINPLDLIFSLPEKYSSSIKPGQHLDFSLSDENDTSKIYSARVSTIDPYIDKETRSLKIKASVDNTNKKLLPGRFTTIKLAFKKVDKAIFIPQQALIQEGDTKKVFLVKEDNTVDLQTVKSGQWTKDSVEILSGLQSGDVIVTAGHQKLNAGTKIDSKPHNKIYNMNLDIGLTPEKK